MKKMTISFFAFLLVFAFGAMAAEKSSGSGKAAGADQAAAAETQEKGVTFILGDGEPGSEFFTADLFRDPAVGRMIRHHRRMMRMMDGFFPEFDLSPLRGAAVQAPFSPRCDLKEKRGGYELTMEVPGLTRKELKITVERNILTIGGEKKEVKTEREESSRVVERSYGAFRRSFTLPSGTDVDKITASCKDGVLTVLIPKREESKPEVKTIPVNP